MSKGKSISIVTTLTCFLLAGTTALRGQQAKTKVAYSVWLVDYWSPELMQEVCWRRHWDEEIYQQPIDKGVRISMALKGQDDGARGNSGPSAGIGGLMVRYPEITYNDGYTEAPDETAYGDFLHLVASAGLAYDHAHPTEGNLKIKRTQKDAADGVTWQVERKRPILPLTPPSVPQAEGMRQ